MFKSKGGYIMLPSNWIYTSEEDEVTEIISEVKRLPIVDVLSSYGGKFGRPYH